MHAVSGAVERRLLQDLLDEFGQLNRLRMIIALHDCTLTASRMHSAQASITDLAHLLLVTAAKGSSTCKTMVMAR